MMKRLIAMLLAMLMLLSLVGCGEQGIEAPNGEVLAESEDHGIATFSYAGTTIPVGLGLPVLSDEEIDALIAKADYAATAQTITTVADAVNYIHRAEIAFMEPKTLLMDSNMVFGNSAWQVLKDGIGDCGSMSGLMHYFLKEDYEEIGYINAWTPVDGHTMGYIYHEGLYYLMNPVAFCTGVWENSWLRGIPSDMVVCAEDFQIIADSMTEYMSLGSGELVNCVHLIKAPGDFACGNKKGEIWVYPVGTEVINCCGTDFKYQETSVDWQSQTRINSEIVEEDDLVSIEIQEKIDELLAEGDYERICAEVVTAEEFMQLLITSGIKEGQGDNGSIEAAFTKKLLWPDKIVEMACRILEEDYEEIGIVTTATLYYYFYVKQGDVYTIYDALGATWTGRFTPKPFESKDAMVEYAITERGDSDATIKPWKPIMKYKALNGQTVLGTYNHGIETFLFADTTIPVGLGLPKLTDGEIDALIAKADYAATAQAITTLADAVNYIRRARIVFDDIVPVSNYGSFCYIKSAWQVLKDNSGQCWTMSELLHYLLKEDYEEVGYIHARTPGDGHLMAYIYHNGKYYLVNGVGYCAETWESTWFGSYPPELILCAEDFQTIADSLTQYMRLGDQELVNFVHLIKSPGDLAFGMVGNTEIYPIGTEVIRYYGPDFAYQEASFDWQSQTY